MNSQPVVSAVLPTRGRQEYARLTLECFRRQTYPNKELVILDDADNPSFTEPPEDVRYFRVNERLNIPQKRNRVNALAAGEIIMHFDSDDWYAPERMQAQVRLLLESGKSMHGFRSILFWQVEEQKAWQYRCPSDLATGTSQTYLRSWWKDHPFIERKIVGSDNSLSDAAKANGQLACSEGGQLIVARIHGLPGRGDGNTGHKSVGRGSYKPLSPDDLPEAFFAA